MKKTKEFAKKRMMFIQGEDYNFLAYTLLIFLNEMGCHSEKTKFKDFRKIAYLIDFISGSPNLSDYERFELNNIYRATFKFHPNQSNQTSPIINEQTK